MERTLEPGGSPADLPPYETFRRVLWPVFGALTRRGYTLQPADASDLIQDFYIDEWASLTERFDPALGRFESYVFAAFFRFARNRILRMEKWRRRMVDVSHAAELSDEAPPAEDVVDAHAHHERMQQAMSRLPRESRDLLQAYLKDTGGNERALARRLKISRYRLRERLIDALGLLATELGALSPADATDERVALALWRDGSDPRSVAAELDVSMPEIHAARKRNVLQLLAAVQATPTQQPSRRVHMNMRQLDPASGEDALVLLRRVLLSAPDSALLISIRERSAEIREALLECNDDLSDKELAAVAENPEWVAKVYGALGVDDEEIDEAEAEIEEAIESMQASEDEEIGIAFAALLDGLPAAYRSWEWIFSDVPTVASHVLDGLRAHASVAGKHELVEGLLRYGITPATIFDATVGISLFVDRLLESIHEGHAVLCFDKAASSVAPDGGLHSQLLAQIRATPACPPQAAPRLLWWLAKVANLRPYLFDGYFTTEVTPGSLQFIADHSAADFDIVRRWTQTAAIPAFEAVACKVATSGSWKFTMG